ncbi:MAG: efflux RND transporter periplasmic adaptor subunit [Rhodocyclaceae bacterium]
MISHSRLTLIAACAALACAVLIAMLAMRERGTTQWAGKPATSQPALTVAMTRLQPVAFTQRVPANGSIMAWQEASIGTEANGLRLVEVRVNVGDKVGRGALLARFAADTVEAELAQSHAAVAEAEVVLAEAAANAQRARLLQETGTLSAQQIQQYVNAERMAQARLDAARAVETTQQLRLAQTRIVAPDDGVISSRAATVGAVVATGQELFRLIRGARLEWRAEVAAADLIKLKPGQRVLVRPSDGESVEGRLRMLAPAIDIQTRNGLVYVDLPSSDAVRAGMFARGEFELGEDEAMTLPLSAVQLREGFSYVMRVGPDLRVIQTKVRTDRRVGDRVEIVDGLNAQDRVVASGGAFLGDGDLVSIAEAPKVSPKRGALTSQWPVSSSVSEGAR